MTFILSYGLSFLSITGVYVSLSCTSSLVTFDVFPATITHGKTVTLECFTWVPRSSFLKNVVI